MAPPLPGVRPPWMARTLMAEGDGFFFAEGSEAEAPPPKEAERSPNAYVRLAGALVRLRRGDFAAGDAVADVLLAYGYEGVWTAGGHLLAHAVPHAALRQIGRRLLDAEPGAGPSADFTRAFVCRAWARAMLLDAVPEMLELYRQASAFDARRRILLALAELFGFRPGDPHDAFEARPRDFPDRDEEFYDDPRNLDFIQGLNEAARAEAAAAGTPLFYRGAPFDFGPWARGLLARLAANDPGDAFGADRLIFEAHSGLRCSAFFSRQREVRRLAAAAVVEGFLESGRAETLAPGVRSFFGQRLPD